MKPLHITAEYPLQSTWERVRERVASLERPVPTTVTRDTYLDAAERIIRALAEWVDEDGIIADPYSDPVFCVPNRDGKPVLVHAQTRFLGGLGQLIGAGRCADLVEVCIRVYEERLRHLDQTSLAPEFWVKEMVYAHCALADHVAADRLRGWEALWRAHDPWSSYSTTQGDPFRNHNGAVFAVTSEFLKLHHGLGGDAALIDGAIRYLAGDITWWGMYRDPNDPLTYDLVVKQQLDLIRHVGYAGEHAVWLDEVCRRSAVSSLLMQSTTGQMPFGGRSNQFHFVEAHFACLCESRAVYYYRRGDELTAGMFKRAGRRAVQLTLPWIMEMEPFRHTKQGFHPDLGHGVDSGGPYSVYGALTASLLATAYHLADDRTEERLTPAEEGGYALALWPAFHKVFASAGGYHVEVDTRADPEKDATGLGRLQRQDVWPETALSGSISAAATYSFGTDRPETNLTIGPVWSDGAGKELRLADLSREITDAALNVRQDSPEQLRFEIRYTGSLGELSELVESFTLDNQGLHYAVRAVPDRKNLRLLVPVILTDGDAQAEFVPGDGRLQVLYRGATYAIHLDPGTTWRWRDTPPAANRNALYRTLEISAPSVRLTLTPAV